MKTADFVFLINKPAVYFFVIIHNNFGIVYKKIFLIVRNVI